jgi:hypothetical protein
MNCRFKVFVGFVDGTNQHICPVAKLLLPLRLRGGYVTD